MTKNNKYVLETQTDDTPINALHARVSLENHSALGMSLVDASAQIVLSGDFSGPMYRSHDDDTGGGNARVAAPQANNDAFDIISGMLRNQPSSKADQAPDNGVQLVDPALDTLAAQLTDGFWEFNDGSWRRFDIHAGQSLKIDIGDLTGAGKQLAKWALDAWTDASGIKFKFVNKKADITFDDNKDGAYSTSKVNGHEIKSSHVNIDTAWVKAYGAEMHTYSMQTYIHEIGHALGLGHAGDYNGSATYGIDNEFTNDSWQASVMSYFSQKDNWDVDAHYAFVMTPMVADLIAIRDLYGETGIRGGDSVYSFKDMEKFFAARTIVDTGGTDTMDFSWATHKQLLDMREEKYSTIDGVRGNLGISRDTVIEIAIGGKSTDRIIGNDSDNALFGNQGKDTLRGNGGADFFVFDSAPGSKNTDIIQDFEVGIDAIVFDNKIYTKIGGNGDLAGNAFHASANGQAHDNNDRIIYETDTGELYYDANGKKHGGAELVAKLDANLDLQHSDFFIV